MPGKERRTATKAGRLPPAEKNLAGHLKFMEIDQRCQGKRLEREERKGRKGGKWASELQGSFVGVGEKGRRCMLTVAQVAPWLVWGSGDAWCILR